MKKFCFLFFCFAICNLIHAQQTITGTWEGKITGPDGSLRLIVHIQNKEGKYSASLDSPDQGAKGIPFSSVQLAGDSLILELAAANARYSGKLTSDTTISGQWFQGASIPLDLKKSPEAAVAARTRPQTPTPPFPYQSTDVTYHNADKRIQYGATITRPEGKGPFSALLLLTGSGPQNRDEELFGHKPFAVIADYLTRKGYLVLRADDRGVGQTTGDFTPATTKDFADDAVAGLDYLKSLPDVDTTKIGLLGHSEGGMIAQIVAAERSDVSFVIFLAAPGEKTVDLMTAQNRAVLLSSGMNKETVEHYLKLFKPLVTSITSAATDTAAKAAAIQVVNGWVNETPKEVVLATTGISNEENKQTFVAAFVKGISTPWFRYFFRYDPDPFVSKIKAKVLALNGDKDVQVIAASNLPGLKASLQKSRSKVVDVVELKGLNHLFQRCRKCTVNEYAELEETLAPEVLETIGKWLEKNVKSN